MMNFIKTLEIEFENYCKDALVQATKGIPVFFTGTHSKIHKAVRKERHCISIIFRWC